MAEQEQLQKNASTTVADTQNSSEYLETRAFAPVVKSRTGSSEQPTPPNIQTKANSSRPIGHSFANVMIQAPAASVVQPKLTIGEPGDKYEQEADNVAAQVVQQINSPAVSSKNEKSVQRQQASEEEELQMKPVADVIQRVKTSEEEELQMKSAADSGRNASADLETSINQARGGGQSLNDSIRQPMEQAFGADFSGVKVHTDSKSDQLNQSIQAKAFTTGEDIFFRQGEYNPGNKGGQELLAHELTHVVQQNQGVVSKKIEANNLSKIESPKIQQQASNQQSSQEIAAAVKNLFDAMDGWGTDEDKIMNNLKDKTPTELAQIKTEYLNKCGRTLEYDLRDELSGKDLRQALGYLSKAEAKVTDIGDTKISDEITKAADTLHKAMEGWGTDEKAIMRTLRGKNKSEIEAIKKVYLDPLWKKFRV